MIRPPQSDQWQQSLQKVHDFLIGDGFSFTQPPRAYLYRNYQKTMDRYLINIYVFHDFPTETTKPYMKGKVSRVDVGFSIQLAESPVPTLENCKKLLMNLGREIYKQRLVTNHLFRV